MGSDRISNPRQGHHQDFETGLFSYGQFQRIVFCVADFRGQLQKYFPKGGFRTPPDPLPMPMHDLLV
jgi:hypothetical protein